ncbi:hypothetical protein MKZ02_20165 [Pseudobacillus sp. FSL P4-0506]
MKVEYLVLNRETAQKVLNADEIRVLNGIIDKISEYEGPKTYVVDEIK